MTLTDKQLRFCQEYVIDLNGTQAAIRAGYSAKTAGQIAEQNLKKLEIQTKVKELQVDISKRLTITADWVTQRFKEISDRCVQAEPVYDSQGNPTGEYRFDSSGANKATEMLGKMIGVFEKDNSQKAVTMIPPTIIVHTNRPSSDRI